MAIKFSQFNLRTDHTSGMYLVGYDGNQNIHITVDNLFNDFINGTENTIAMFGAGGDNVVNSILSQDTGATLLTVAGQLNVDAAATFDTSITVTGDSTLNGNVTLGDTSADLITQTGTLYLNGPIKDTTDTLGAVDQILVSDATGELTFQDLLSTHVESAEVVKVPVKNAQGSALAKGDPVYISGSVGASGRLEVQLADASNTLKMPAVGLLFQDLANNGEGYVVITGKLRNVSNSPIDGVTPTEGDVVYVKPSGTSGAALTTTKPVYDNFIQNVGKVGKVNGGNSGTFVVSSILRSNDIPNLTPGRLWVGSTGNTIESQTLFVDEANTRLGIGTALPATPLDVNGDITSRGDIIIDASIGDPFLKLKTPTQEYVLRIDRSDSEKFQIRDLTNSETRVTLDTSGNIGLGTTSPFASLHIKDDTNNPGILVESSQATGANFQNSYINLRAQETSTNTTTSGSIIMHGVNTLNAAGPKTLQIRNLSFGGADVLITNYDNNNTALNPARFKSSGQVQFEEYGSGSFAGTATKTLAVDANGNIIETAGVSVDGSGTANYVTKWLDTDTITDSVIYDDGTNIGIGTTLPSEKLNISANNPIIRIHDSDSATRYAGVQFATAGGSWLLSSGDNNTSGTSANLFITRGTDGTSNRFIFHRDSYYFGVYDNTNTIKTVIRANGNSYFNGGNVGIGTTSPVSPLHVNSTGVTTLRISTSSSSSEPQILLIDGASDYFAIQKVDRGITFKPQGSEAMRIDSSGNVGIGTTSPGGILDVAGNTDARVILGRAKFDNYVSDYLYLSHFDQGSATNYALNQSPAGSTSINAPTGQNVALKINNSAKLHIQGTTGNVGIGTTSPGEKLHVAGNIRVGDSTDTIYSNRFKGINNADVELRANNGYDLLLNSSSGDNVGIGASNPLAKLQINGENAGNVFDALLLINKSTTAGTSTKIKFVNSTDATSTFNTNYINSVRNAGSDNDLIFGTSNSDRMTIDSSGNVGIGTTSPTYKLDVNGPASFNNAAIIDGLDAGNPTPAGEQTRISGYGIIGNRSSFYITNASSTGTIYWGIGGAHNAGTKMTLRNTGNLGIGTTSPASKLDVNGGIRMADDSSTASASNVGTLKYYTSGNNSYVDMCMQTGATTYAWVNIVQNNW